MQQQVSINRFLQSGLKRINQTVGQIPNESDGIG